MIIPDADFLHRLADAADSQTLPRYRSALAVETKEKPGVKFDPVTEADRAAERAMREVIEHDFPDHGILGEEYGEKPGDGRHCWVLDPVDGTRPFLCGIPVWGTLIGFTTEGIATAGMLSQPFTGERFWATPAGAWHRHHGETHPLRTRSVDSLGEAILHTTAPIRGRGGLDATFAQLSSSVRLTRYGGECYAMAMLAAGHIDLCFEPSLQPYDIVALIPIIERAGGVITSLTGGRVETGGAALMAGCPRLHEQALRILAAE